MADPYYNTAKDSVSTPGAIGAITSGLRRIGHFISIIPGAGQFAGALMVGSGHAVDATKSLLGGEVVKSGKQLLSGAVDTVVTAVTPYHFVVSSLSFLATGSSFGEVSREFAATALDGLQVAFKGEQPKVTASYPAAVAFAPYQQQMLNMMPAGGSAANRPPMYWTNYAAERAGLDPQARREQYLRGEGKDHVAALQSAAVVDPYASRG